jgi:competence protein ComEC
MRAAIMTILFMTTGIASPQAQSPSGALNIYYSDTEGGQSTLFVSPAGESLLVDTGNAGDRDLGRIVTVGKSHGPAGHPRQ